MQVRDEYRKDYDPSRGGWGKIKELQQVPRPIDEDEFQGERPSFDKLLMLENQTSLGKRRRGSDDVERLEPAEGQDLDVN